MRSIIIAAVRVTVTHNVVARLHNVHRQANLGTLRIDVAHVFAVRGFLRVIEGQVIRRTACHNAVFRLGTQVAPEEGLPHFGPVVIGKHQVANVDVVVLVAGQVVVMMHKTDAVQVLEGLAAARAHVTAVALHQDGSATLVEFLAAAVLVGSVHLVGAAHGRLVSGLFDFVTLFATYVPGREQEILPAVLDEARAFDTRTTARRDLVVRLIVARLLARLGVQLNQADTARVPRAVSHPVLAIGSHHHIGINRVVVVAIRSTRHFALVRPTLCRIREVQVRVRRDTDGRRALAKNGAAVEHAVLVIEMEQVRSPDAVSPSAHGILEPLRAIPENLALRTPLDHVRRGPHCQVVIRGHEDVAVFVPVHRGIVAPLTHVSRIPRLGEHPLARKSERENCRGHHSARIQSHHTKHIYLPFYYKVYYFKYTLVFNKSQ